MAIERVTQQKRQETRSRSLAIGGANPSIDRDLGASLPRVRQALDAMVDYFANRLEELNPRIRQVLSDRRRNLKAFLQTIHDFAAQTRFVTDALARRLLVWTLLAHWTSFISIVST
jgi:hypothetical protein